MREVGKVSIWYSWPVIILSIFRFWPVSIFLISKRVSVDRKAALIVGNIIGFVGGLFYTIGILMALACIMVDKMSSAEIVIILFFIIAGFVLRRLAKKLRKDAEEIRQYLVMIVNNNVRNMNDIASAFGKTYEDVKKDIEKMIQKEYLKNAYIDESAKKIVLAGGGWETDGGEQTQGTSENNGKRSVTCRCCGANNTISGERGECEYCGSPLP